MLKSDHLQETALRYFLEVVRCGTIREASQRLHVASSAISRQIAHLEEVLGTPVFERRPHGMVLSAAGEVLAAHARRHALEAERVVADILALQGLRKGKVRLASTEGFAMEFLPQAVAAFQKHYPGVLFHLDVTTPANVSAKVREGDADIGVTFSRSPEKDIRVEFTHPAPVMALMRAGHPFARLKHVSVAQLQAYPLALPGADTTVRQLFDIACSRKQLAVEPALTSNCLQALQNFVLFGDGISLAGEVSVRYRIAQGIVVALPIRDRDMGARSIELQTLVGRTLPQVVRTFLNHLQHELERGHTKPSAAEPAQR